LHLVNPDDGLCNHCRRQFEQERVFFSRVLDEQMAMQRGQINNNWNMQNIPNMPQQSNMPPVMQKNGDLLGKRARKINDFEM